jgi:exodeoxyribonuclease VII large subunit
VVTSPTGAAIQDFLHVLHRRQRGIEVVIFPVRVQGKGAAAEIAEAIRLLGNPSETGLPPFDVLVVTRGGGSLEDLWEFNDEAVARAVAASPVPVVSAVGHEIDFTICDFAADFRAPTPSAAAEILSADSSELLDKLQHLTARLGRPVLMRLDGLRNQLLALERTALFLEPRRMLQEKQQTLDRLLDELQSTAEATPHQLRLVLERHARILAGHSPDVKISELSRRLSSYRETLERRTETRLQHEKSTLARNATVLRALNPSAALARGYTITMDENGQILRSATDEMYSKELTTRFHDGEVKSQVRKN